MQHLKFDNDEFHPTPYRARDYLSMVRESLNMSVKVHPGVRACLEACSSVDVDNESSAVLAEAKLIIVVI